MPPQSARPYSPRAPGPPCGRPRRSRRRGGGSPPEIGRLRWQPREKPAAAVVFPSLLFPSLLLLQLPAEAARAPRRRGCSSHVACPCPPSLFSFPEQDDRLRPDARRTLSRPRLHQECQRHRRRRRCPSSLAAPAPVPDVVPAAPALHRQSRAHGVELLPAPAPAPASLVSIARLVAKCSHSRPVSGHLPWGSPPRYRLPSPEHPDGRRDRHRLVGATLSQWGVSRAVTSGDRYSENGPRTSWG